MSAFQTDAFAGTEHQRPRPGRYDKALRRAAAEALVPEIEEWLGDEGELDETARERIIDLLASHCGDDGYEIAREFEREGYEPNAQLVELLDGFDTYSAHAKAVRAWLAETGARPLLAIGTTVTIPARMKEHAGVDGEITRSDERSGEYTVFCASLGHVRDGVGSHGLIFPWEEVEKCNPAALRSRGGGEP